MSEQMLDTKPVALSGLAGIPWLRHGFSHRAMGDMGVSPEGFARLGIPRRLEMFLRDLGMDASKAALAHQVHEARVAVIKAGDSAPSLRARADALICRGPGIPLVTFGADCPNVFLVDTAKRAIGLAHSGRLGTLARIVPQTAAAMRASFGTRFEDLVAAIGPSIGPCCYPTDLWALLAAQLAECGVGRVFHERICTHCHAGRFYSYRKSKDSCGRMAAVLMVAGESAA